MNRQLIYFQRKKSVEDKVEEAQPAKNNFSMADSSVRMPEKNEWDEFGNDLYAMPEVLLVQSGNPMMDAKKDCQGYIWAYPYDFSLDCSPNPLNLFFLNFFSFKCCCKASS
ncbi:hypothetical protein MKW98_023473 [Papaver atlanticum]|uniref:Uncharacterized protein n=1 Tax=Papaver atlanticum TaxID=357466 RepID=A0AAD4SYV4_9MAGN|nr:hypothetical protein MKW98_023473 [Papaver atlanticum]